MSIDCNPPPPEINLHVGLRHWKQRLVLSLIAAIVMTAIPLGTGWLSVRGSPAAVRESKQAFFTLMILDFKVKRFLGDRRRLPDSLDDILDESDSPAEEYLLDPWGRAYDFEPVGTDFSIKTYGRDSRPGGFGLDADRTNRDSFPPEAYLTLWQFLFQSRSGGVWFCSLISGLCFGVLAWRDLCPCNSSRCAWASLAAHFVLWGMLSLYAGDLIATFFLIPARF